MIFLNRLGAMSVEHSLAATPSVPFACLPHILEYHAKRIPDAPAILAPGRAALTYSRLYQHIVELGRTLRAMGIGRHDRVAVVLPNGPEMAVTALTVAAHAGCAPLNPAYGEKELEKYFADLRPRAVIAPAGIETSASRVARAREVRVFELSTRVDAEAGLFTLAGQQRDAPSHGVAKPGDVALLLFTSGTTARPKLVPLTHSNICTSAYVYIAAHALSEADRCLNVLPLFHGHGLIATVIASLAAGSSVVCTPGCEVNNFFEWLSAFRPTWYSAVPPMHQAILSQNQHGRDRMAGCGLRFVRSASAPLPPRIFTELERTFATPVIELYGMTESASAAIACNPLPPRQRKVGSVGLPAALDVAIMNEGGNFLPRGQTGEVVIRGASVMSGYDSDPMTTKAAFAGDWFKTGDHGYFDDDGYLFLVGRKQDIINRGGEKFAPREVDEMLMEHPAVAEAVTFAVPHPTLGEDVAAAIVLRPHAAATPKDIRQFAMRRIAEFKVPRQVVIVSEIPKGPSGKLQRIGLAAKLGLATGGATHQAFIAPRTPLEKLLAEHWAEILQLERVSIHDDFFTLGGDSLLVTQVVAHIYDAVHLEIDASQFFEAPTIAKMAHYLETLLQAEQQTRRASPVARVPREGPLPASMAQKQLWNLQRLLRGIPLFNVFCPLRLPSACDPAILERSINEIVQRHEILRTTFAQVDGDCVQVIAPQLIVKLAFDDLNALPESKREKVGQQLIQQEALYRFDLARGPLFRSRLVRLAEREHLLLISMHGIIVDAWSLGVLVEELFNVYDAFSTDVVSPLAPLPIQYADFAHWQRRWQSHPDIAAQLAYWREQLRDPLPAMRLAPASEAVDAFRTARRELALPATLTEAAKLFGVEEGGTLYMVLVAALKTLLQRYLGQDDLRLATLVANRNRPGTDRLIGPLANTVILRTDLGGDPSLREVVRRVRRTILEAFAHQDFPFEELVDTLARERTLKPRALAPVMMALHNFTLWPRMRSRYTPAFETAMGGPLVAPNTFDLSLMLRETAHGVAGSCIYKPHLFDAGTIDRLLWDFQDVLQSMVTRPERPISEIHLSLKRKASNP
jgi:acyl-CoA synthetase (AMP-forming)/AMP-acid ligase II